ncbi:MAG: FAD-dependent oxidoreductase [Verrucomicrobia bacterium]|nr:FAD-dependent oxidoreductase [Verrucomicrobiota bacterium]MBT7069165.1 FAD-dependent oxidoreductase [Verrucomicrobiota bacterium]MBT7701693.1 FAD-dependent oxidoreductase [Verrucomicrobiota bacterium]
MMKRLWSMLMTTALICSTSWGGEFFKLVKQQRAETKMVVDGYLYVDAEDFDDYGGWRMDTQFVHLMGSAFMMATGVGTPVADATTTIDVPKPGEYHVWVRARNWVKEHKPGRFEVLVNGKAMNKEFGAADTEAWTWEKGGAVVLDKGPVKLALHDLTGFYGRCDAVLLTIDANYVPPQEKEAVCKERARLQGLSLEPTFAGAFDVIVVGGGSAGVPAAIAAARNGAKTALIQNRPTLGGNCSVEAGVGVNGAGGNHPGWREAGIIEEAGWITAGEKQINYSLAFKQLCDGEENLSLFLNQHVFEAEMDGKSRISGVKSVSTLTGLITEYKGTMFIDCSGDGWLGYYAGAEYRHGREASSEFKEKLAPKTADQITMSGCIMGDGSGYMTAFRSKKMAQPVDFVLPPWVKPIDTLESPHRSLRGRVPGVGTWWMEHPGDIDDAMQAEEARDELIKVSLAFWDYVKNRSEVAGKARNYDLVMIPILDAKRESRRLVGDTMVNQNDVESGRMFPDRIAYSGWDLDIHHPKGIYSGKEGSLDFKNKVPLNSIPFRSIYSKNIENLLMAGRCLSYSHVALGTVRVQSTLATVGQAAGTAAAMCAHRQLDPRTLGQKHIAELQQELLKDDQTIQRLKNEDPNDLARAATVTASSSEMVAGRGAHGAQKVIPLNMDRSVMIPVGEVETIKSVSVYLESKAAKPQNVKVRVAGVTALADFAAPKPIGEYMITVPAKSKGWISVPVKQLALPEGASLLQVALPAVPGVGWPIMAATPRAGGRSYGDKVVPGEFYSIRTAPPTLPGGASPTVPRRASPVYEAKNVINGWTRTAQNRASMWRSDPAQALPQWVELDFGKPTSFNTVQLTFVTNPSGQRPKLPFSPTCVRDYDVEAFVAGKWVRVVRVRDNFQRHRVHAFVTQTATKLRLTVSATHGDKSASLFEVRVYKESK